jgi:hypothetical protein
VTESHTPEIDRLRAPAFAAACASNELTIRARARRDRERVDGRLGLLLFDIVNVQNWTALRATASRFSGCSAEAPSVCPFFPRRIASRVIEKLVIEKLLPLKH